jgi:hypothetical protein
MSETIPLLYSPDMPSWRGQGKVYLYLDSSLPLREGRAGTNWTPTVE